MKGDALIVEHEPDLAQLIALQLQQAGLRATIAPTARRALERAPLLRPDVILIAVELPDLLGTELCRRLREASATQHTPIIMISPQTGEPERLLAFTLGADDVVLKPFSLRELTLRVQAVCRRASAGVPLPPPDRLQRGDLTLHRAAHRVFNGAEELHLTRAEFDLLQTILGGDGRVFSRDDLLNAVWGPDADVLDRTVDVHIMRLRRKLGDAAACIETVRGVGYRAG